MLEGNLSVGNGEIGGCFVAVAVPKSIMRCEWFRTMLSVKFSVPSAECSKFMFYANVENNKRKALDCFNNCKR